MVIPGMLINLGFHVPSHPLPANWWGFASLKAPVGFPQQQINQGGCESPVFPSRWGIHTWDCCSSSLTSSQSIQILLWQSSMMGVSPQWHLMDKPCQHSMIRVNAEKGIRASPPPLLARGHHGNNLQQQKEMGVLGFPLAADGGVFQNNSSFSGWFSWLPSSIDLQGLGNSVGTRDG